MVALSALVAVASDLLSALFRKQKYQPGDLSSVMLAMMFTLMLSAASRYEIVFIGTAITMLIKHAFGGFSGSVFQPAAFGFAVASICWPNEMFRYPGSFHNIGLGLSSGTILYDAPAFTIKSGGVPILDRVDLLLGDYPGPMGGTFCVILFAILLLMIMSKVISWHIPSAFLLTVAAYAYLFPRIPATRPESVMYELLSGAIVFGAVYIVGDPVTSPVNAKAKLIYGFLLGVAAMLFNHYGVFQMGLCFAVLLINPLVPWLDRKLMPKRAAAPRAAGE
jgi:electron transport complex protein RnfD